MANVDQLMRRAGSDPNTSQTWNYTSVIDTNIYKFMEDSYTGRNGYRDGTYLIPHQREMFYNNRRDTSYYKNYIKPIIRSMVEPVFVKKAQRKTETEGGAVQTELKWNYFLEDVDNAGTNIQDFTENVILKARINGVSFVIMDNFTEEEQPATDQEAKDKRIFPYVYIRTPRQLVEWDIDEFGNPLYITFEEKSVTRVNSNGDSYKVYRRRRWDDEKTVLMEKKDNSEDTKNGGVKVISDDSKWVVIEEKSHNLGRVPVIRVYVVKKDNVESLLVDPPLYDLARLNHAIFNKDSEIRELERAQGFSIFYMQSEDVGNVTLGPLNAVILGREITITPGFAAPDPAIQKNLVEDTNRLRDDLYKIAEQNGVIGVQSAKSGVAMQWEFFARESILQKTSQLAIDVEMSIADLFMLYVPNEEFLYTVSYPMNFQPNDRLAELQIYDTFLDMPLPPTVKRAALEKAMRMLLKDEDPDILDGFAEDIKSMSDDEVQAKVSEGAFTFAAGQQQGSQQNNEGDEE